MTSMPSAFRAFATRWPPEIISDWAVPFPVPPASALGVVVALTSGCILSVPRPGARPGAGNGSLSVQVVDRALHVVGQVQRVVAHEALGEVPVTGLQRLDDVHVVDDRALGPVVLADRPAPDRPH